MKSAQYCRSLGLARCSNVSCELLHTLYCHVDQLSLLTSLNSVRQNTCTRRIVFNIQSIPCILHWTASCFQKFLAQFLLLVFFIFFQKEGASSCFRCENFVWTWIDDATGCQKVAVYSDCYASWAKESDSGVLCSFLNHLSSAENLSQSPLVVFIFYMYSVKRKEAFHCR